MNSTYAQCTMITFDLYFENDSSVKCHFHGGKSMSLLVDLENWTLMLNFFTMKIITAKDQFRSVTQSRPTLCNPMDWSTPGLPVHHQLLEFTQTHVYWVSDAIQPSHPLSSPSPPALNLSWCQGLFKWVSSSHQVAKVLEFKLQHQSFQWIFRIDLL